MFIHFMSNYRRLLSLTPQFFFCMTTKVDKSVNLKLQAYHNESKIDTGRNSQNTEPYLIQMLTFSCPYVVALLAGKGYQNHPGISLPPMPLRNRIGRVQIIIGAGERGRHFIS